MGTVTKRITSKGEVRFRALIQVRKQNVNFTESKTFSKKTLAETWIKKREAEIELNPGILTGQVTEFMRLDEAIDRYIKDVSDIGTSKLYKLNFFKTCDFAKLRLNQLTRETFATYTLSRRMGDDGNGISKSTAEQDLYYLKSVLLHAELVLHQDTNAVVELMKSMQGLRNARQIDRSETRDRLPTNKELQALTNHFYALWQRPNITMPIHLIMWLAIYTTRRRAELFNLLIDDYDAEHGVWLVRDVKNPKGSKGNHKRFKVSDQAQKIITLLLEPETRKKMMRLGGDPKQLLPIDAASTTRVFTEACKIHGIQDLWWHDFRHEGATRLAEQGLTIPQIQQYTLHDSWSSLQRYVNLDLYRKKLLNFEDALKKANDYDAFNNPNMFKEG
ncbi:site-specific integrase [Acinetobacter johnsonii]|uniref:site-specific integrase n=1 Tax=Acinetobacter johnsonii TaxID=40214 RepID=UPI0030172C93